MESVFESNEFLRDRLKEEREVALRIDKGSAFQSRGAHTLNAPRPIDRRASGWVSNDMSDDLSERTGV